MEPVENAENLVTLKVAEKDRDWLEKEQVRLRGAEGSKPTQAEMFRRMAEAYVAQREKATERPGKSDAPSLVVARKYDGDLKKAARIFTDRFPEIAKGLAWNVKLFDELFDEYVSRRERRGGR